VDLLCFGHKSALSCATLLTRTITMDIDPELSAIDILVQAHRY